MAAQNISAGSCNLRTKHGQEELPHVRVQAQRPRVPGCDGAGMAERGYPSPWSWVATKRSHPTSEAWGGGREEHPMPEAGAVGGRVAGKSNHTLEPRGRGQEEQPHVQEAVAARAQEGLKELSHTEGQEGWR